MPSCADPSERTFAKTKERLSLVLANQTFVNQLKQIHNMTGIYPTYLMAIMILESGICPQIVSSDQSKAVGLFQRVPEKDSSRQPTVVTFGRGRTISFNEFKNLSVVNQMEWWLYWFESYRVHKGKYTSPGATYAGTVYLPGRFNSPNLLLQTIPGDLVLTRDIAQGGDPENVNYYRSNKVLDKNNDGYITVRELDEKIERIIINYNIPLNIGGIQAPPIGTRYFYAANQAVAPVPTNPNVASAGVDPSSGISRTLASLQSFHPKIQYELTKRKFATETAQVYMPALRLTALTHVLESDILGRTDAVGAPDVDNIVGYCPSIGPHGENAVSFEDIYMPSRQATSTVGYATVRTGGNLKRVPLLAQNSGMEPPTIPMPGIVSVSTNRTLAGPTGVRGGLFRATIKLVAYSVGQVDTLMRYFLRNGTHLVLEMGQLSSTTKRLPNDPFNWKRERRDIEDELKGIVVDRDSNVQERLINKYVYENFGNYDIFVGYAATFKIKYDKSNTYDIELVMHSTQQMEVNNFNSGVKSRCDSTTQDPCVAVDMIQYFSNDYSWMDNNFKRAIANTLNSDGMLYSDWSSHVIPIKDTTPSDSPAGTTRQPASVTDGNSGYLISWKYFVEVILNNEVFGILNVFPEQLRSFMKRTVISKEGVQINTIPANFERNKFLIPNEVGYHPNLRSIDPGIMIIYNPVANLAAQSDLSAVAALSEDARRQTNITTQIASSTGYAGVGDFSNAAQDALQPGSSLLTRGIWLNSNAIIDAFVKTDSISKALDALLTNMNNATQGYWNLQLFSLDTSDYPGMHVIDAGLSKNTYSNLREILPPQINPALTTMQETQTGYESILNSDFGTGNTPKYIYVFNNKNKRFADSNDLGGELIDINLTLDLPISIMAQTIAGVGGMTEKGTIEVINKEAEARLLPMFPIAGRSDICGGPEIQDRPCLNSPQERTRIANEIIERRRQERLSRIDCSDLSQQECDDLKQKASKEYQEQLEANSKLENQVVTLLKTFKDFGNAINYIELNPVRMLKQLGKDSQTDVVQNAQVPSAHAFNSSNLSKLLIDLTMPGIGGILLWQSFYVDKIPSIVKNGYYMVTEVGHEFTTSDGWTTRIQGRYRRLPTDEEKAQRATIVVRPELVVPVFPDRSPQLRPGQTNPGTYGRGGP